jgi:hypothetical protein
MIVVADASVLVAELIRARGRLLVRDVGLGVVVTEEQWDEAQYELDQRLRLFRRQSWLPQEEISAIEFDVQSLLDDDVIEVVQQHVYQHLEPVALRRVPRDASDWPTVARAIVLKAGILTNDYDFFGCGCPTWTVETLRAELAPS